MSDINRDGEGKGGEECKGVGMGKHKGEVEGSGRRGDERAVEEIGGRG